MTQVVLDGHDLDLLANFWSEVLGYVELARSDDEIEIGPAGGWGGPQPTIVFVPVPEPKQQKIRLHIDVNPTDQDQEAELARLLALGAKPVDVGQGDSVTWHVLADPEGNEFCLLRTRVDPVT